MISLFDLHCDTLYEQYKKNLSCDSSLLHVSLSNSYGFRPYVQGCAIWSDYRLNNDDAYENYKGCLAYARNLGLRFSSSLSKTDDKTLILTVEDARLLNGKLTRLDELKRDGVKSITLNWKGESCIGGGWDTTVSLSPFGLSVVEYCAKNKIAVDLSHSSHNTHAQVLKLAEKHGFAPIFSHSNSFSVCNHKRNVTDEIAKEVSNLNGLIGLSLCPHHLTDDSYATVYSVIKHAIKFLELGCLHSLALGCDFDGVSSLPSGINHAGDLQKLHEIFQKELGTEVTNRIFYQNSYDYFTKLLSRR